MPDVTCPTCHTRQGIDADATGYACTSCGADWDFVTCGTCGHRFHAAPDAPGWRCPDCGAQNARPHARRDASRGRSQPLGPNRTLLLAAAGVLLIALVAWALTRGDDGTTASTATPSGTPSASVASGTEALCAHLVDIQALRFEALGEAARNLRDDAATIAAAGDGDLARDVRRLAEQVAALQAAYDTVEIADDDAAERAVLDALEPIPC